MLSIGRARHPGPSTSFYPPGFSIEFLNVGGWLSRGDLALESSAHFLAVAETRLVPARARTVTTQLRQARRSSVWAPSCQDVTPGGHAGVGGISLHGAPLSLPTLFDPSFKEFFRIDRAMRVILPFGNGGVVHLFVIYGYQGAENDPEKLQLSEHRFAEARMCSAGQPVILAGDFNADPIVIPSLAKGISDGQWVDLERAFAIGRGVPPSSTCQVQRDEDKGSRRDFLLACPIALAAASACYVLPDRWFTPHFAVYAEFSLSAWDATVDRARTYFPLWPACWLQCTDRSRSSASQEVRNNWDVYIREVGFVPFAVREHLFRLCNSSDVGSSWLLWSREAEASLARAYLSAGGRLLSNPSSYVGRGSRSICTMRLGGRCHDRIFHVDRSDEFDVTHFGFFLNSSLAPVLRFQRSFVSVCNVLKGIRLQGFSDARVAALWCRWRAVVRLGPTGLVTSFDPWTHWIPTDLHGFYKWALDTLALLNEFVLKVVHHRQTSRSMAWSNWIREDLTSRTYQWLRPEFVHPAPYLVCRPQDSPNGSGILVQPALIAQIFVCVVTRSTTAEVQHNDMMMRTNVQNGLRHEMALEMWIVSVHEKSEQL